MIALEQETNPHPTVVTVQHRTIPKKLGTGIAIGALAAGLAVVLVILVPVGGSRTTKSVGATKPQMSETNTAVGASTPQAVPTPNDAPTTSRQAACLSYGPEITLTGNLTLEDKETTIADNEPQVEHVLLLTLNTSICTNENQAEDDEPETNVLELQLYMNADLYEKHKALVGQSVIVKGTLNHSTTIHDHTKVTMDVEGMEPGG